MPNFIKPVATQMPTFTARVTVTDGAPPTVAIEFSLLLMDAMGLEVGRLAGDLTPYLTQLQITSFTNAALALQAQAKAALLTA